MEPHGPLLTLTRSIKARGLDGRLQVPGSLQTEAIGTYVCMCVHAVCACCVCACVHVLTGYCIVCKPCLSYTHRM